MAGSAIRVRPGRFLGASVALAAVTGAVALLAGALPGTRVGAALGLLAGLVLMPVMASPIEWLVHRYVYHRATLPFLRPLHEVHHRVHHYVFFPTWRYVTGGPPRRLPVFGSHHDQAHTSRLANALTHLEHFAFYMVLAALCIWAPVWLLTGSLPVLAGLVIASVAVSDLMVTVHDTIHRPGSHRLLERQPWFRFLDRHHYIHHVDTEANVNFLLPLGDWLYGTLRRSLTSEELARHGTWEQAKAMPVGQGEPAHEAVRAARSSLPPPRVATDTPLVTTAGA
jgi:hypothetical protein